MTRTVRPFKLKLCEYSSLNSRQKESYNFQKISGLLADYGFTTIHLSDDWNGADFIARHVSGKTLFVQLKSRLNIDKKYSKTNPYVCFPTKQRVWYMCPHNELVRLVLKRTTVGKSISWAKRGGYSQGNPRRALLSMLGKYRVGVAASPLNGTRQHRRRADH
jgi:hypothetical protein